MSSLSSPKDVFRWIGSHPALVSSVARSLAKVTVSSCLGTLSDSRWYKIGLAELKRHINYTLNKDYLTVPMLCRMESLIRLSETTELYDLKYLVVENLKVLEKISCVQQHKHKQGSNVSLIQSSLQSLDSIKYDFWPEKLKSCLKKRLKSIAAEECILDQKKICLIPDKETPEACDYLIQSIAALLGVKPLIIDCFYLKDSDFLHEDGAQSIAFKPKLFTQLWLRCLYECNLIVLKNVDKITSVEVLKIIKYFLSTNRSIFDPCIGDRLSFNHDLIITTAANSIKTSTCLKDLLRPVDLGSFQRFTTIFRANLLWSQAQLYEVSLSMGDIRTICAFYQTERLPYSFVKFVKIFLRCMSTTAKPVGLVLMDVKEKIVSKVKNKHVCSMADEDSPNEAFLLDVASCDDSLACQRMNDCSDVGKFGIKKHFKKLLKLKKIVTTQCPPYLIDLNDVRQALDLHFYGQDFIKEEILSYVAYCVALNQGCAGKVLCFVGDAGVGKTCIAKAIACALKRPFYKISCAQIIHISQLKGLPRSYQQAQEGLFAKAILETSSLSPVVLLDEVDKLFNNSIQTELVLPFLEMLDPTQNAEVLDNYLEVPLNFSQVLYVLTANSIDQIPLPLLDRCKVIYLPKYSNEEKFCIAKKFILPKILNNLKPEYAAHIVINDGLLKSIVSKNTCSGVRQLRSDLESLVSGVIKRFMQTGKWASLEKSCYNELKTLE